MDLAVHPPIHGALSSAAELWEAHVNILVGGGIGVTLGAYAVLPARAIRTGVINEAIACHIEGVNKGCCREQRI